MHPGSAQYRWLETQLAETQRARRLTLVLLHHGPYSQGPHGWPAGTGAGHDPQSGIPVRSLTPLLVRRGVHAVLAGHGELWERSEVRGKEQLPGGGERDHTVHFYDIGVCGDGLRGPEPGLANPWQRFLAHRDAPERWRDGVLVDGGIHYGHLEIDVVPVGTKGWRATLTPVYVFPLVSASGAVEGFERRVYDDIVRLSEP